MKTKLSALTLIMVLFFSISIFAGDDDGTTHSGGKSCPNGTTCLNQRPQDGNSELSDDFLKSILNYLESIFG